MLRTGDYFRIPVFNTIAKLSSIDGDLVYFEIEVNGRSQKYVIDVTTMSIDTPQSVNDIHYHGPVETTLEVGGFVNTCLDPRVDVKKVSKAPELQRLNLKFFKNHATGGIRFSRGEEQFSFESIVRVFLKDSQD